MKNPNEKIKSDTNKTKPDNSGSKSRDGKSPDKNDSRVKGEKKHGTVLGKINDE